MEWEKIYQSRLCSADEAIRAVKSDNRLYLSGNCSIPQVLLAALVKYGPEVKNVEICHPLSMGVADYVSPEMEGHIRVNALFIGANVRKAVQEGRADFTPVMLSELPLLFKNKILPLDAILLHVSPPDRHGYVTLGIEAGLTKTAAESARIRIAEVNPHMPRMLGDTFMHISQIDHFVQVDYPVLELFKSNESDHSIVEKIAGYIAEVIPDGATLQLGIGGIPDAVLKYLYTKKDLAVHSELFSDGVIDLVNAGVINGCRRTQHIGKITAGFLIGTKCLYDWANDNPLIELHRTEYINNPFVIARNARQVAINSAIEIDFTGQVCSDSIGTKLFSGVGGQLDFIYGASLSEGGVPIIALPSTTCLKDGTILSRIVPTLKNGAGVVTTRNHVHYVVTEYGIVDLYGKTVRQRAKALISLAHPNFRPELEHKARELNYI